MKEPLPLTTMASHVFSAIRKREEMKKIVVVALAVLLPHSVAFAGVVTDVLDVTAQISTGAGECTVSVSIPVDFGTLDAHVPVESNGELVVQCPNGVPYSVKLDAGQNTDVLRGLLDPVSGGKIGYYLYDSSYEIWGDDGDTYPYPAVFGLGTGLPENIPVIGYADPTYYGTPLVDGTYSDVVTVTVIY